MGARLGQHFLTRPEIADRIAAAAEIRPGDAVMEIGPGRGILTQKLLEAGARVTAVELDDRLHENLAERFKGQERLSLVHADFLKWELPSGERFRIAANLPYAVATPILQRILDWPDWSRAVLMFQKEVAERIVATSGSRKYGVLSVSVALKARAQWVCDVPRNFFAPRPAVDSAVIRLDPRSVSLPEGLSDDRVMQVVRAAFGQRRKQAANALAHGLDVPRLKVEAALQSAGIAPQARAEEIGLDAFIEIARHLTVLV